MLKFSIPPNTALAEWKATHVTPPTSPKIQKRRRVTIYSSLLFSVLSHPPFHLVPCVVSHLFMYSSRHSTSSLFFSVFPFGLFETLRQVGLDLGYLIRLLCNIWWVKCRCSAWWRFARHLKERSEQSPFFCPWLNRFCVNGLQTLQG